LKQNEGIKTLLSEARKIDIACALSPAQVRKEIWNNFIKSLT